jgi:hypothetical protein
MPRLLEKYRAENDMISKDIPVLKEVVEAVWRKEDELKVLKTELNNLERQIKLSLKPIEQTEGQQPGVAADKHGRTEGTKLIHSSQTVK